MSNSIDSFSRISAVVKRTGMGRSTIYRKIKEGTFPKNIKLSERTSVFSDLEVSAWIEEQKQKAVEIYHEA